jgi:dihydroflavonol-4-reductase
MSVVAVTGGTGFVGSHLVRLLSAQGETIRCLVRPESKLEVLDGIDFEAFPGDLRQPASLLPFLDGCSVLYHVAADYRLWSPHPDDLYRSNVDGTKNILSAAQSAGVSRIVYTSTVGCLGIPKDGTPGDENTPVRLEDMIGHYKRSKFLAEKCALDFANEGLPVVIVNPSTPVGPGDHKPTPTGKIIIDFINGRIPAFVDTGLNLIDVRDCAAGHILAAAKGRVGENYILGSKDLTLADILSALAQICHRPEPKLRVPYAVAYAAGALSTAWADLITHRPPGISLESVRMSRKMMFFSPRKAIQELELPQSQIELALSDAVAWFVQHGYARL